jgi:hypothetical protein
LEVSVHASGYPPLFRGEWELRLNDIGGAKSYPGGQVIGRPPSR